VYYRVFWGLTLRLLRALLTLFCVVLGSPLVFAADAQWVEVRSPNFSVITDAGDKRGRDVALHFEQMRSVFGTLMTRAKVNLPVPLQIVAFRNSKELSQVAPIFNGKPIEVAGLFEGGNDRSFIILDMSAEDPWTTVFHEYAHRLMDGNLSFHVDPWFEEGFAEYFSSIEVDDKQARVGKIPEQTYRILQQMGWMKVSDLFRVQQNSRTYNESGDHRTTFYAESGLVVHYLYDNLLVPKLNVYFDTLQIQKKPVEQAIQAAFGMTAEQFDKALRDYLRSGKYRYYPVPTPSGIVASQFTVTPVRAADAHAMVADIHAHSPDYRDKALGEFQDVLKTDPDNAAALRGAGFVCMEQKDYEHAEEYLRRAAERDKKDPRVHFYYAVLLNREGPPDAPRSAEIKKELEMSIALDPTMADAYSLLGFTQAVSGEPAKGIATLNKALELSPRNENYTFNLASAYVAAGRVDTAIGILQNLANSMNPEIAARARQGLKQATLVKEQTGRLELRVEKDTEGRPENGKARPEGASGLKTVVVLPAMHFIKGKVIAVDCTESPRAVLTVAVGEKSIRLHVADGAHVVVIGADEFSCDWAGKMVAVNYHERADGEGDVVSVEIQ
jgi:tetratricopeptide (TPR) repeat protein